MIVFGYVAMSALFIFAAAAVPDFTAAGRRKAHAEAVEAKAEKLYWDLVRATETDDLWVQRFTLLADDRAAYTDRYLDEPVRYDWAGFVEDELARIDAEIAALADRSVAA